MNRTYNCNQGRTCTCGDIPNPLAAVDLGEDDTNDLRLVFAVIVSVLCAAAALGFLAGVVATKAWWM